MDDKEVISFHQFIYESGGSGVIYEEECLGYLSRWKEADWSFASDYISPIVGQVIADAAEINRPLYEKLMTVIVEAHREMGKDIYPPERPELIRIK